MIGRIHRIVRVQGIGRREVLHAIRPIRLILSEAFFNNRLEGVLDLWQKK